MADLKAPEQSLVDAVHDAIRTVPLDLNVFDVRYIIEALSAHGLHIVSEADKRVLEACAAFPTAALRHDAVGNRQELSDLSLRWTEAELARRGGT